MKNKFFKLALFIGSFGFLVGCSSDDATGDSTMTPSNPTLSVALDFNNTETLVEANMDYAFTVSISEPQIVDVSVNLSQIGGDATEGADFTFPHAVRITAGSTSASGVISILEDDLIEDTETAVIQIATGTESNVNSNGQTVTFNIANLVNGDLLTGLTWDAAGFNFPDGSAMEGPDLADLRLLVTDVPYTEIIGGADGSGFESYTLSADSPDGSYYIVTDWYSAFDAGDGGDFNVDVTVSFNQTGVINDLEYSFPAALNSGNSCASVYYILAQVDKSGDNYTITPLGENSPVTAAPFVGTATITADDWADYAPGDSIEVEAGANENEFWIRAYDNPYISNPDTAYMVCTIDPATGNVTVMSNEDFDYGCSEGDVTGTGVVNACAGTIDLVLTFGLGNCGDYAGNAFSLEL